MSNTIGIDEAQARLRDIIAQLAPDEVVIITDNQRPIARLVGERPLARQPRQPGNCKGMITLFIEDDEHLGDFGDYMP